MKKPTKQKKGKVPKITEAEYVAYVSSLRDKEPKRDTDVMDRDKDTPKKVEG